MRVLLILVSSGTFLHALSLRMSALIPKESAVAALSRQGRTSPEDEARMVSPSLFLFFLVFEDII
jgi:hypothetical protein